MSAFVDSTHAVSVGTLLAYLRGEGINALPVRDADRQPTNVIIIDIPDLWGVPVEVLAADFPAKGEAKP